MISLNIWVICVRHLCLSVFYASTRLLRTQVTAATPQKPLDTFINISIQLHPSLTGLRSNAGGVSICVGICFGMIMICIIKQHRHTQAFIYSKCPQCFHDWLYCLYLIYMYMFTAHVHWHIPSPHDSRMCRVFWHKNVHIGHRKRD